MMGTRSGSLDPSVILRMAELDSLSLDEVNKILNKQSGLLGVSGVGSDDREILKAENKIRKLVYEFKKKKYYEEHKEERKKYQKEYYENNKTEKKHYDEIYYKKNKEKINANKKEHRKLTNYDKIYYKNHRDEI